MIHSPIKSKENGSPVQIVFCLTQPIPGMPRLETIVSRFESVHYIQDTFSTDEPHLKDASVFSFFRFRVCQLAKAETPFLPDEDRQESLFQAFVDHIRKHARGRLALVELPADSLHHFETFWEWTIAEPKILTFAKRSGIPILHFVNNRLDKRPQCGEIERRMATLLHLRKELESYKLYREVDCGKSRTTAKFAEHLAKKLRFVTEQTIVINRKLTDHVTPMRRAG